ncbi:MAG: PorP/SprF family type IX secretion system membrane protein [Saprospirales bacterium]|nr:PorP/SprF family type IX secretion system membrane protein [Saprospirales bacterium]MBK8490774.1 PorP/SprF family type IX secretion system membrane protein [Saprospirales bacterium]
MKRFLWLLIILGGLQTLRAQDPAIFNHYLVSPILINPSYAGFEEAHILQGNFRNQWTGFPGAPVTYGFNYNGPIGKTLGLGFNVLGENIASITRFRFQLNYAFRFNIGENVKMAAGFSTEFSNLQLNNSALQNPFYEQGDNLIDAFNKGESVLDATLGTYASFKDNTFIGLAFPNLIVAKISDIESGDPQGSFFKFFIFNVGHRFEFDNGFSFEPSLMMRKVMTVPFNLDFNAKVGFLEDRFIAGLSYRTGVGGALGVLLGTSFDQFRLFYSYDLSFQQFQQYNSGAHELTIALRLGKRK